MSDAQEILPADAGLPQHRTSLAGQPPVFVRGEGCTLYNLQGTAFLDAVSGGVWCVNVGYGRESIAQAVYAQLKAMPYTTLSDGYLPAVALAEKLVELMPGAQRKVYFSNSGSVANEKAFKIARRYGRSKFGTDKHKILYRHRDYHGTTLGTLAASGQEERRAGYGPLVSGFIQTSECNCTRCPFGKTYPGCHLECAEALEKTILQEGPETVAAFIVEPVTAGGGVLVPVQEYFPRVQEICKRHNVLLIMDEVVCGFGRTGKWFGYQHYNVQPDIVTMSRGMTSAYQPLSATVVRQEVYDVFLADSSDNCRHVHDTNTYDDFAAPCAASLENMRIIKDEQLLERVQEMGAYFSKRLKELECLPVVLETRGVGLFAGVELVEDKRSKKPLGDTLIDKVQGYAAGKGVLMGRMKRSVPGLNNVIFLAPAFIVTQQELDRVVDTLAEALKSV